MQQHCTRHLNILRLRLDAPESHGPFRTAARAQAEQSGSVQCLQTGSHLVITPRFTPAAYSSAAARLSGHIHPIAPPMDTRRPIPESEGVFTSRSAAARAYRNHAVHRAQWSSCRFHHSVHRCAPIQSAISARCNSRRLTVRVVGIYPVTIGRIHSKRSLSWAQFDQFFGREWEPLSELEIDAPCRANLAVDLVLYFSFLRSAFFGGWH